MSRFLAFLFSLVIGNVVHAQIKPYNINVVPQPTRTLEPTPGAYTNINLNYVRTWSPLVPFTDTSEASMEAKTNAQIRQETSYYDRMGREVQLVKRGITPGGNDIVHAKKFETDGKEHYMYLPYPSTQYTGAFRTAPFTEQYAFYNTPSLNDNRFTGEKVYYAENVYEQSPLNRAIKEMPVGNSWTGSNRGTSTTYTLNTAEEDIVKWGMNDNGEVGVPNAGGFYPANTLTKTYATDAHGKKSVVYRDLEGKLILEKEELTTGGVDYNGWLSTYYVYDDFGLLRFIFPPQAVSILGVVPQFWNKAILANPDVLYNLCFNFKYDKLGRRIWEKAPGTQAVEMVYDNRDRIVFKRNGRDKVAGRWRVTNYDQLNRVVMEGLYNSIKTREQLQNEIDLLPAAGQMTFNYGPPLPVDLVLPLRNTGIAQYKATGSIVFEDGFTSVDGDEFEAIVDPGAVGTVQATIYNPVPILPSADVTPFKYYYYDHYSWGGNKPYQAGDISKPQQGNNIHKDEIVKTNAVSGYLTGTGLRVLGTNQWLYTTNYYDEKGRIIQAISDNAAGGVETVTNLYDFNNKLISSYQRHTKPGNAATPETRVLNIYNYDHAGRLMTSIMKLNDDNALERILASNTYYETGELKTKNLGGLRDVTYDYSIGGQLKSINKDYIYGAGTGSFGEELFYDYGYTENQFTGEIAGVIWRGDGPARSYGYEYDPTGRLTKADFTQKDGSSNWLQTTMNYSVLGPVSNNGRIKYNSNGNLLEIIRKGMKGGVSTDIDVLSYRYYTNSNQLLYVTDAGNDPNSTLGDFKEITTGQPVDYIYDENGNLKIDENKGITSIVYNELDLPISISVAGKGMIYYKYDATGTKIEKRVIDSTGAAPVERKFEYIGGLVYEDNVLKYISHSEGRIRVVQKPALPIAYYYDYFIKDHLGNVRIVYSEQTDISTYNASMEPSSAELENRLFSNIDASRVVLPSGYPASDSSNQHVAKLNAKYPDKRIGPSLVLKVMGGDAVSIRVNAFFKSEEPVQKRVPDPAVDMLSPLLQAFGGIAPSSTKTAGAGASTPFNQSFTSGSYQRLKEERSDNGLSGKPKAYLNYILFDEQMNLVEENSGVKQIQSAPDELQHLVKNEMPVTRNGYLYVYTSNESQHDVYFDDLTVVMSTGRLNEETHYYPFGLTMKEISSKAITAPTYPENNIKYNGKELQAKEFTDGSGLEWYDYGARMYDPQVARWHVVDAKNGNYPNLSPYLYCGDNPVANVDVDGNTHYPAINVLKATMQGWGQRAEFRQWQLSTPAGLSYMLSRQREDAMRKDVMTGIAPYISDKTSGNSVAKAMAEKGVGTKLFLGMSEMMIGMTPVLGSTVRALAATKYGDKKGAVLNATFAFIEGAAIFGGLSTVSNMGGGAGTYDGVRAASNYLQAQGVPRAYRKQILESFEVGTISLRTADNATFGLRFYGGAANQNGRYLFPTFTNYTNRAGLALPPSWNSMSGISQFQIAPGSTYIFGRAASQGGIYGGGSYQMYINNLNNLIK